MVKPSHWLCQIYFFGSKSVKHQAKYEEDIFCGPKTSEVFNGAALNFKILDLITYVISYFCI